MISYEPLWKTMAAKKAATYTLINKGGISSSTLRRLKAGDSVSTNTIDALCRVLSCGVSDVIEYTDEKQPRALRFGKARGCVVF